MGKVLLLILSIFFLATALFSGHQLWQHFAKEQEVAERFCELSGKKKQQLADAPKQQEKTKPPLSPEWTPYDQYGELFAQNHDMIGWISIDGTRMDYPVMQTTDQPNFYLKHGFDKRYSGYGVPYISEECTIDPQSDNTTIYGHNIKSGKMFGVLEKYKNKAFYHEHPLISFDTRIGFGTYEIIAVFKVHPDDFQYNLFVNASDQVEFDDYVNRCKTLSLYDTEVVACYGDKLISLSTCEYSQPGNRLVVVARKA